MKNLTLDVTGVNLCGPLTLSDSEFQEFTLCTYLATLSILNEYMLETGLRC